MSNQKENLTKTNILIDYPNKMFDIINNVDDKSSKAIMTSEQIRSEIKFDLPNELGTIIQLILNFISSLATVDPTTIHFAIARAAIKSAKESLLDDTSVVDSLSRRLVEFCNVLKLNFTKALPKEITEQIENANKQAQSEKFPHGSGRQPLSFKTIELNKDISFKKDGMFLLDKLFLETLKNTGPQGKDASKEHAGLLREKFIQFSSQKKEQNPLTFWFNIKSLTPENPFYLSPALIAAATFLYRDVIEKKIKFKEKNPEGLTTNIYTAIVNMALGENDSMKERPQIKIYNKFNVVGNIDTVIIPATLIESVRNGAASFNSLTALRLLEFLIRRTYSEMIKGNSDFRILKFPGGAKEIAEKLKLVSNKDITKIKNLLHAWNHLTFHSPKITSRLLSLGTCKARSRFSHQEGYEITVLSPLLPYRIYEEKNGFIIPLLREPPFIGHRSFHARQKILQWKITEEFVNQSNKLTINDFVFINSDKWIDLVHSCNVPERMIPAIQKSWTGEKGFLERKDTNSYTLKGEDKALEFLKEQGFHRNRQSQRGIKSAQDKSITTKYKPKKA